MGKKKQKLKTHSEEEITNLALDVYQNKVFGSWNLIGPGFKFVNQVFLPLAACTEKQFEELKENDVGAFYEYYSECVGHIGNGLPMFTSMKMLTMKDARKLAAKLHEIQIAVSNVVNPIKIDENGVGPA